MTLNNPFHARFNGTTILHHSETLSLQGYCSARVSEHKNTPHIPHIPTICRGALIDPSTIDWV